MISVSQVKDPEERAQSWERARKLFAKDVCEHCAKDVPCCAASWTDKASRNHWVGGDRMVVSCYADKVWALKNPFEYVVEYEPGPYFDEDLAHIVRLSINKVGAEEVGKFLQCSEDRAKQWAWGRGRWPAPSVRELFCTQLVKKFELE